jgi:hypothetical protein
MSAKERSNRTSRLHFTWWNSVMRMAGPGDKVASYSSDSAFSVARIITWMAENLCLCPNALAAWRRFVGRPALLFQAVANPQSQLVSDTSSHADKPIQNWFLTKIFTIVAAAGFRDGIQCHCQHIVAD